MIKILLGIVTILIVVYIKIPVIEIHFKNRFIEKFVRKDSSNENIWFVRY